MHVQGIYMGYERRYECAMGNVLRVSKLLKH